MTISKKILYYWISLHYILLLLSYSEITLINKFSEHSLLTFWPVTEYFSYENKFIPTKILPSGVQQGVKSDEKEVTNFFGVLNNYDYSEFILYTILGIIVYLIFRKKKTAYNMRLAKVGL